MHTRAYVTLTVAITLASVSSIGFAAQRMTCSANIDAYRVDRSDYALMAVIGSGTVHFISGAGKTGSPKASCPNDGPECHDRAYLQPSDVVLAHPADHSFVCALFGSTLQGRSGYLPAQRLKRLSAVATPPILSWRGVWKNGDNTITIAAKPNGILVDGQAWWPSKHPGKDVSKDLPNEGDFRELVHPFGSVATITPADNEDCKVALKLVSPYLLVTDNAGGCGGMNVRFNGVYRRLQ